MTDRTNYCTGCKERQDRIEALTAEIERLRRALHAIQAELSIHSYDEARWAVRIARAALETKHD